MKTLDELFSRQNGIFENKTEILSLNEYLQLIENLRQYWRNRNLWYRGVVKSEFKLIPSLYRNTKWKYSFNKELKLIRDYKRNSFPHLKNRDLSIWELYEMMQHYGTPTRLLDWSQGSLIALLFALLDENECETPSVYILDPYYLNKKTCKEDVIYYTMYSDDPKDNIIIDNYLKIKNQDELPDYPVAVLPPLIDPRIVAQKSCFTIHGKKTDGLENLCNLYPDLRLVKLKLANRAIDYIKYELITTGITNTTIFPDLEGLSKDLKYNHLIK